VALRSLAFSRIHHSALVNRGSWVSSSAGLDLAKGAAGLISNAALAFFRRWDAAGNEGQANSRLRSRSEPRAQTPVVLLEAQPPRVTVKARRTIKGSRRIRFYARGMVNRTLKSQKFARDGRYVLKIEPYFWV
jgi:hypothetical protein